MDASEVESAHRAEQGFNRQESDARRCGLQVPIQTLDF
jgi:hypothetical protein